MMFEKTRVIGGYVSLRDFEIADAVSFGSAVIKVGEVEMRLSKSELEKIALGKGVERLSKIPSFRNKLTGKNSFKEFKIKWRPENGREIPEQK